MTLAWFITFSFLYALRYLKSVAAAIEEDKKQITYIEINAQKASISIKMLLFTPVVYFVRRLDYTTDQIRAGVAQRHKK
jgi:hypothetical protein